MDSPAGSTTSGQSSCSAPWLLCCGWSPGGVRDEVGWSDLLGQPWASLRGRGADGGGCRLRGRHQLQRVASTGRLRVRAGGHGSLYPISVDGMLGVATLAAVMRRSSRLRTRAYIWRLIGAAIAVSVAGNALHTTGHGGDVHLPLLAAAAVSAVPAASLAAALHLLVIVTRSPAAMALDIRAIRTTASMADTRHADSIRPGRTARARVDRLVKRHGADISAAEVARRTGLSERHAA